MRIKERTRLTENDRDFLMAVTSAWGNTKEFWNEMEFYIEDEESIVTILTLLAFLYKKNEGLDALNLIYSYCKVLDFEKFPFDILYKDREYGMAFLNEFLDSSIENFKWLMDYYDESGDHIAS